MINDEYIINYFFSDNGTGRFCPNRLKNINQNISSYLQNRFEDSSSIYETIYRIKNKLYIRPSCKICGGYVKFNLLHYTFNQTCSKNCGNKFRHIQKTKIIKEKYGVENAYQSEQIKEKIKEIKKKKYNDPYYNNKEKTKITVFKKYGVNNVSKSKEIKEKIKETYIKNYGVSNPNKIKKVREKIKRTCLDKYGYEYSHQSPDVINKTIETIKNRTPEENRIISEKISQAYNIRTEESKKAQYLKQKETCLKRYGYITYLCTPECQKKSHSEEAINKSFKTQRKNGTLKTSKEELKSYNILQKYYKDVIHQYKDKNRYPFKCDFYIPSLDLFIECQYGMFHNKKPFIGSKEDLLEVELIKEKSKLIKLKTGKEKTRYDALLNTWTIRDVNKREIAKQNKLNYIEFWNINELINWVNKNIAEERKSMMKKDIEA